MKRIEKLDKIIEEEAFKDCGISSAVIRAYIESLDRNWDDINFEMIIWSEKIPEIVQSLKELGIESFTLSDQSTGLMSELHEFIKAGCKLVGCTEIRISEYPNRVTKKFDTKQALKMQIL